ncbi:hypothetical protein Nepgr_005908 [Nepenthes gracilis]|uniref:TF-B3 domain-containing protein n=1 Tax=Nepenthes gracilis TaxID=150966 RepID=A0AAD3S415_NEPGR|nr:hypothetical protein Nepgr_005908 [Nepenthes gracilis]
MEEGREDCRTMEEKIRWTKFQSIYFCQFLPADYCSQLMIPKKFSDNLMGKLAEKVGLKAPSGATWDVELVTRGDQLLLGNGWEEFVNAYSLVQGDILMFKYNGNSQFDVMMFDHISLCVKEAAYSNRKCVTTRTDNVTEANRCSGGHFEEAIHQLNSHEEDFKPIQKKKPRNAGDSPFAQEKQNISGVSERTREKAPYQTDLCKDRLGARDPSIIWEKVKLPPAIASEQRSYKRRNAYHPLHASKRRPIAVEEKHAAMDIARSELTKESFIVVMRPTHVYKSFYLNIPSRWLTMLLIPCKKHDVHLHLQGKTWETTLRFNSKGRGGLSSGWQNFAVDNGLEEHDVCLFKLASQNLKTIILDVSIFRVAPGVVPPTPLTPCSIATEKLPGEGVAQAFMVQIIVEAGIEFDVRVPANILRSACFQLLSADLSSNDPICSHPNGVSKPPQLSEWESDGAIPQPLPTIKNDGEEADNDVASLGLAACTDWCFANVVSVLKKKASSYRKQV